MRTKLLTFALLAVMATMLLAPMATARKGVGLVWSTEVEMVNEGETRCVEYGVYNPWDEDVTMRLSVSKELADVVKNPRGEKKLVPAETASNEALPYQFCFDIGQVYSRECLIGNIACEKTCADEEITYSGKIMAVDASEKASGATGSVAELGMALPLKLRVKCLPEKADYTPVAIVAGVVLLIILALYLRRRKK